MKSTNISQLKFPLVFLSMNCLAVYIFLSCHTQSSLIRKTLLILQELPEAQYSPWSFLWYVQQEQIRNFSCQVSGQLANSNPRWERSHVMWFLPFLFSYLLVHRWTQIFGLEAHLWFFSEFTLMTSDQKQNLSCDWFLADLCVLDFFFPLYFLWSSQHDIILPNISLFQETEEGQVYLFPAH